MNDFKKSKRTKSLIKVKNDQSLRRRILIAMLKKNSEVCKIFIEYQWKVTCIILEWDTHLAQEKTNYSPINT